MTELPVEILLVDDNPNDVELALHALKPVCQAQQIQVARDGVEALEFLYGTGAFARRSPTQQPRLILMDLKLPRLDGIQVLERVKTDPRTQTIPVAIMTSSTDVNDVLKCYSLGVNSYIVKPVDFVEFQQVARVIGQFWLRINYRPPL